jgi:dihydrofolate reductase
MSQLSQEKFFLSGVVAMDLNQGIGYQNRLLVQIKKDTQWFKKLTLGKTNTPQDKLNAVVMGKKTWESLPSQFKPLPGRINYVLSHNPINKEFAHNSYIKFFLDWESLLIEAKKNAKKTFIIGGQQIFNQSLKRKEFRYLYVTQFQKIFTADTFFPSYHHLFSKKKLLEQGEDNNIKYKIYCFSK